MVEINFNT